MFKGILLDLDGTVYWGNRPVVWARKFINRLKKEYIPVGSDNSKLNLYFNPVMTTHCNISEIRGREPDTEYFPIHKPEKFIPKWLKVDFKNNQWQGKFGY